MRNVLPRELMFESPPEHHGLAYDMWAPIATGSRDDAGKVADEDRPRWLAALANRVVSPDYPRAYERWRSSFSKDELCVVELRSRLLIGHGNPSPTEVGLTVHHTWGVPIIPGSALKGLVAHYVDTVYGPSNRETSPSSPDHPEPERARFRGPKWEGSQVKFGPGDVYRALFGAPAASDDPPPDTSGAAIERGATRGAVEVHDALFVPGSVDDKPFAVDVLTVHQRRYYGQDGGRTRPWPSDHDSPNPVGFLSVRPRAQFLLAVTSADPEWRELCLKLLLEALEAWGVGAKTSAGYGRAGRPGAPLPEKVPPRPFRARPSDRDREGGRARGRRGPGFDPRAQRRTPVRRADAPAPPPLPPPSPREDFDRWWNSKKTLGHGQKVEALEKEGRSKLLALTPAERDAFYKQLRKDMQSNKAARARLDAFFKSLEG